MKITQVISDTNIGGAGVLLTSIVENLMDEFEFEIIMPRGSLLYNRIPSKVKVTELQISKDKSFSSSDFFTFYSYFIKTKPQILHTHASFSARLAGKLASAAFTLSTRHCAKAQDTPLKYSLLKSKLYNFSTDITVSTADFATENLIREGIPNRKIITIKNGSADFKKASKSTVTSIFEELRLPSDTIIIGSVARLEKIKGQDLILRAAPEILAHFKNAHFLFLGTGSMMNEYQRLASSLGIEKNVTFLGFREHPENYQQIFTLNVNASRGTETSCLATSECLSLGIPTVASDFGGNPEMIRDFENGFIFSSDNPHVLSGIIMKILRDNVLYNKLSRGARESYLCKFSIEKMIAEYRRLYRSIETKLSVKSEKAFSPPEPAT